MSRPNRYLILARALGNALPAGRATLNAPDELGLLGRRYSQPWTWAR